MLDWSEADNLCLEQFAGYQMILGADLVYKQQGVTWLLATLRRLLQTSPNVQLLLGHCSRHVCVDEQLFAGLEALGLEVIRVGSSELDARVSIYRHPRGFDIVCNEAISDTTHNNFTQRLGSH